MSVRTRTDAGYKSYEPVWLWGELQVTWVLPLENRLRRGYTAEWNTYQLFPATVMGEQLNPTGTTASTTTPRRPRIVDIAALLDCWTLLQH
jgi:hypothetical protein